MRGFAPALTVGGDFRRCQVYVDDCAEGIALIAERGRLGEPYLLVAGNMSYRELYALWSTTPGGMKQRAVLPRTLAVASGMVAEPVQRWLRLPNLLSAEAARAPTATMTIQGPRPCASWIGGRVTCANAGWRHWPKNGGVREKGRGEGCRKLD